jgi:hypothetical protein
MEARPPNLPEIEELSQIKVNGTTWSELCTLRTLCVARHILY